MMNAIKDFLAGTSGYEYKFWPARGVPTKTASKGTVQIANDYNEKRDSKLAQLRRLMKSHKVGIYLVMEQDEHGSEYVAETDRRIRYISNFAGSAGFVSIGETWAELATDSRYYLIAAKQLGPEWQLRKLGLKGVGPWDEAVVAHAVAANCDVGVDATLISTETALRISGALQTHGLKLIAITPNLVDQLWGSEKPTLPAANIISQPLKWTGKTAAEKVALIRDDMLAKQVKSLVIYSLEEIAWLLNLRGGDVPYVPIFKSYLVLTHNSVQLFLQDPSKLSEGLDLSNHEGLHIDVRQYKNIFKALKKLALPIWLPKQGSWALWSALPSTDEVNTEISPINLRRAVKTTAEIEGIRQSQLKCSASIVQYLAWLNEHIDEQINEYDGGLQLLKFREKLPDFRGNSFETISSVGANASMPHYAPAPQDSAIINRNEVYLLDSGSHFIQGSTDITRTTHFGQPTDEEIQAYTLVLKGQLAVATTKFPEGTSGFKLDILARQFLWHHGLDYGHGTGHGIGSYLNIHELPLGIGMSQGPESILKPGHFVSDEPGYYKDGQFGVRLENDLLVVPFHKDPEGRNYYGFEIMTLVPYEPKLIDIELLTPQEIAFINEYHAQCKAALKPFLTESYEFAWLEKCTKEL